MDRIINVKVAGSHLSKDSKNAGSRGEANITNLRITFDGGWNDFDKKIIFLDARGLNPVVISLLPNMAESDTTYLVPIPGEPMAIAGELTFVIEGTKDDKVQKSLADTLVVKDSPDTSGAEEPVPPTEGELAQLRHGIEEIKSDIVQVANAKEDAERFAKQAETHSQQALTAVGKSSYIGEDGYWYAWNNVDMKYYCTGVKAQAGSRVHYGENPPADAEIWIDPNGEAPKVGSDLGENNKNHPHYVRNRTHYVEGKLYGETHFTTEETSEGDGYTSVRLCEPLKEGVEYPYETDEEKGTFFLVPGEDGTAYVDCGKYSGVYYGESILFSTGCGVEGYIIIGQKPIYHPLAEEFIPECIARVAYVEKLVQQIMEQIKFKRKTTILLPASEWVDDANGCHQIVDIQGITPNSMVDIQLSDEQMDIFSEKNITFVAINEGGVVTVYCKGVKPTNDYEFQVSIVEVAIDEE